MNCQEFEQYVVNLAEGQMMDVVTREDSRTHAAECLPCRRRLQNEQVLSNGLRAFAAGTADAEAPPRLKATLRAAFEAQAKPVAPAVVVPFPDRVPRWPRWALAAAAVVLVTVGVAALLWLRGASSQPQQIVVRTVPSPTPTVQQAPPSEAPTPVEPELKRQAVIAQHFRPKAPHKPQRHEPIAPQPAQPSTRATETEVAAQFIPLSSARHTSQEGLVVRVEVSRASLIAMGLPLDASRAEGNIKADLKVGVNGVPLAIRLLQ